MNKDSEYGFHLSTCPYYDLDAAQNEINLLRYFLRKLVENNVTYWDSKGEVRHDVGTTQAEAMEIFRQARRLLLNEKGIMKNGSEDGPIEVGKKSRNDDRG